ncbi:MAG: ubiquitin-like domain-containing protein [Anaerolineae bacterium]
MLEESIPPKPGPLEWNSFIRNITSWRLRKEIAALAVMLTLASILTVGYLQTQAQVTLMVDGYGEPFYTHQTSVEALLKEAGLEIQPQDIVSPGLEAAIADGDVISVRRASPVTVQADDRSIETRTHSQTLGDLLQELGIALQPRDRVILDGQETSLTASLPSQNPTSRLVSSRSGNRDWHGQGEDALLHIAIQRAVPIHLDNSGHLTTIHTTEATLGEALRAEGIILYLADRIEPSLSNPISEDMQVHIQRSKPATIQVDGRLIKTRTLEKTVAEALAQEGVVLLGKDYTEPSADAPIDGDVAIRVVRVKEEMAIEQDPISFETAWQPDPNLEVDHQRLDQEGENGVTKRRIHVVYEDGQEVERALEAEWVDHEPTNKVIAYGTKIVLRELETPAGNLTYWRKVRALATSYTAATSGKSPDHPQYGITRLGWQMRGGIVAVDPQVINLETEVYVPGYGVGVAADTGGKVRGRHVDLGYEEDELKLWYEWVDVYLLAPPPHADQIRWVLPGWPRER